MLKYTVFAKIKEKPKHVTIIIIVKAIDLVNQLKHQVKQKILIN